MKGLHLRSLTGELKKVPAHQARKPVNAIVDVGTKLEPFRKYIEAYYGDEFDFSSDYYRLPIQAFKNFGFDDLCKVTYSSAYCMDRSVDKLFETNARYEVIRKIRSSFWRWGYGCGTWNEVVDAYQNIRHFSFVENPDFEIRLDYTTYFNEHGYSKYSRTYLDGVFAFLVYYKKEHVMTIGFSIMQRKRLLIQQVQGAQRAGNRYLYKLPQNRVEFVIDLFCKNFPGYQLYLIDGKCLVDKTIANYRGQLEARREISGSIFRQDCRWYEEHIAHLKADSPRLESFYKNTGRFVLGPISQTSNGFLHYQISI